MNCIDNELLKNIIQSGIKSPIVLKQGLFSELVVYNEKYLRANIKSFEGKINTNFH